MAPLLARLASARAVRQQEAEAKAVLRVWRGTSADTQQARADEGRERICVRCYLVITPTILRGEGAHLRALLPSYHPYHIARGGSASACAA